VHIANHTYARNAALFEPEGMHEGRSIEFDNRHWLFLGVEHEVG
jgi:hypothetical protein